MSSPPSPPPARPPLPGRTTICALGDDLLREIFARLTDLPNLARAAFTCHTFLRAVRSSPAFRRRFRSLRAPPLLAFFVEREMDAVPVYPSPWRPTDPGLAAAFRDADFLQTRGMRCPAADHPGWEFDYSLNGEILIAHRKQWASYSPLTRALALFPDTQILRDGSYLEFHTLSHQEEHGLQRVVCARRDSSWTRARVAVFLSHTMEWQIFPWVETRGLVPKDASSFKLGKVVDRFVYWTFGNGASGMLVLNTATSQFHQMDVPPPLKESPMIFTTFKLGQTKEGKLEEHNIFVWLWGKDVDGVERWMLDKSFPLRRIVEAITCSMVVHAEATILAVIDGFVYLSVYCHVYDGCQNYSTSPEWFLSFCLETAELHQLYEGQYQSYVFVHPYVIQWPPCLVHSKDGSEAEVTENCVADDGHVGKDEPASILITALQSFKEALIKDDEANIAETRAFFSVEDEKSSLVSKITTLDARLTSARDHILRISADSAQCKKPCLDVKCRFCFLLQNHS
uniref:F-box domain-containing protein n=1 Tax=Hordeum vulgare subsp. vulgare TaxID=112509 RepID=A0A8I6X140_HORVV